MFLKRLNNKLSRTAMMSKTQLLMNTQISARNTDNKTYFTFMDKVKEATRVPMRHLESFFEPSGKDYESQLPQTENLYGNSAMVFNAYLTHNSIDVNTWHDMDNTVHSQFGTVDNPVLIFTSDSSWRIVICQGPGVEDDSHAHEKMFYFLREGPLNRCHICGQVFKLIRLKDEYSEVNDYYSMMFTSLTHFDVQEEDTHIPLHTLFGDRPSPSFQYLPSTNVYVHVNPDEADHMLVDPAYKLEKLTEAHEKMHAMLEAYHTVELQLRDYYQNMPIATSRQLYSNWMEIEKSIRKLDRWFLKIEKYNARQFIDPDNHERRERRMIERKKDRWTDNYTYFFGGLSEEEQMYRDYFETDLENDNEDAVRDTFMDEVNIAESGEFDFKNFDFIETSLEFDSHEGLQDLIDRKLFQFKYRMNNDSVPDYMRKMDRVVRRQLHRAQNRDKAIETNLAEAFEKAEREDSIGVAIYQMLDGQKLRSNMSSHITKPIHQYMVEEAVQQYKDYYESDAEEQSFFEYIDDLPSRDKIKFISVFEDHTIAKRDGKGFVRIPKREYNPELSFFSNLALDFVDFKDRVYPLAQDAARLDSTLAHQRMSAQETIEGINQTKKNWNKFLQSQGLPSIGEESSKGLLSSEELLSTDESVEHHVASSHKGSHKGESSSSSEGTSEGTSESTSEDELHSKKK